MRKAFLIFAVALLLLPVFPAVAQADAVVAALEAYNAEIPPYGTISADDLGAALIERDIVLLDVREVAEFEAEAGHIEGSFNVPIRELPANLDLLPDLDAEIVVICAGGARAMLATASLRTLGYTNVSTLAGGFGAWAADYPTTSDVIEVEAGEVPAFDADVLAAVTDYLSTLPEGFGLVRADALNEELIEKDIVLIDVRSPEEWDNGYIGGAEFVWVNEFMASADMWPEDKDAEIVIYCASSYRGGIATVMMRLMGYTNVRNLVGGLNAWVAAGLPLEGAPEEAAMEADPVYDALVAYNATLPPYGTISADDLGAALIERDIVLLDVREVAEFEGEAGHIEGSFNVPIRELPANLDLLPDLDAEIVVICAGGARAMLATASLRTLGYSNVSTLTGGFGAWAADYPTTNEVIEVEAGEAPAFDADVLAAVTDYLSNLPDGFGLVRSEALSEELIENDIILIDVRSPEEWANGYIAGAEFVWVNEFMANMDMWPEDKDAEIVIYCASSYRGGVATVMMSLMGYNNVRNLVGGINAWVAAGLPLEGAPEEAAAPAEFDLVAELDAYVTSLPGTFNALRVGDLEEELAGENDLVLVDVRTVDEYVEGHIEGAINIPLTEITMHLDQLPDLDANIVVYCGSGHRSALAMTGLNLLGYSNARSLLGGVNAWTNSELPVTDVATVAEVGTAPDFNPDMLAAVDAYLTSVPAGYYVVRADGLNEELVENPDIVLLDVRTDGEFGNGYIDGAIHMPLAESTSRLDEWPAMDASIVVYDNPTHRSTMVMMMMQMLGYEDVRTLGGGTGAWESAGFPLAN